MTSFGRLGIAAAGAVAILVITDVVLVGAPQDVRTWYLISVRVAAYAVATAAAGTAAATFGWWREPIARPWTLFFVEFLLLLINYIIRWSAPDAQAALDATLLVANLAQIGAYVLVSRTLSSAGIGHLISPARRVALTVTAFAVAVAISWSSLAAFWQAMGTGSMRVASLVALLTDIITFTLIAPLAMSTFALRGGQVFWIFAFLTISVFGWMFNELGSAVATRMGGSADVLRTTRVAGILVAALFNAAAATTQWAAARRAMRGTTADA